MTKPISQWRWDRIAAWSVVVAVAVFIVYELLYIVVSTLVMVVKTGG